MFRYFRGGKLFVFAPSPIATAHDTDFQANGRTAEWFWLCEQCAVTMTIISGLHRLPHHDSSEMRVVQMGTDGGGVRPYLHPKEQHA